VRIRSLRVRVIGVAILFLVAGGGLVGATRSAGADQLSGLQAQATQLEGEINATTAQVDAAGQAYDAAESHLTAVRQQISTTSQRISTDRAQVHSDVATLREAAVQAFVTDGAQATEIPLFAGDLRTFSERSEYSTIAEGDLGSALARLHTAETVLDAQETTLQRARSELQSEAIDAASSRARSQAASAQLQAEYSQDKGEIATLVAQQQAAQQAAQEQAALQAIATAKAEATATAKAQATQSTAPTTAPPATAGSAPHATEGPPPAPAPTNNSSSFVPPSNAGQGAIAVAAAESQLGVPYIYADATPGVGFDCSGLTMWAWAQAGVQLEHFSGAQMQESTPVPVSDLQPGDLLFYGPNGDNHVTMYIGGGMMIQAPYPGASVDEVPLNLTNAGGPFAGAGRP